MTQAARPWLAPAVPLYRFGIALRNLALRSGLEPVRRLAAPVVSVGNLSAGGAGKTPLVIELARALTLRGLNVDVLSRGYCRSGKAVEKVDPLGSAERFGDEPLVIAREAGVPVYVATRRYDAGLLAEQEFEAAPKLRNVSDNEMRGSGKTTDDMRFVTGHDFSRADEAGKNEGALAPARNVHLLDDGFQHRQLYRDIDILLLSSADLGDRLLPAGNLREPLAELRRAAVLAIPSGDRDLERYLAEIVPIDRNTEYPRWTGPVWRIRRSMQVPAVEGPVVAFCGIARPAQFFAGLEDAGLHVASRIAFADHHRYIQHDIDCILDAARTAQAAALVTTEKDRVRLTQFGPQLAAIAPLQTAGLRVEIEDEAAAIDWLLGRIARPALTPSGKSSSGTAATPE